MFIAMYCTVEAYDIGRKKIISNSLVITRDKRNEIREKSSIEAHLSII